MKTSPQVIRKAGRNEYVVLPYGEYEAMRQRLEDVEDLLELRKAIRRDDPAKPGLTLEQLKVRLGLKGEVRKQRRAKPRATRNRGRRKGG
jgi:hypothetical protein